MLCSNSEIIIDFFIENFLSMVEKISWNKIFENSFKVKSKLAPINKFNLSISNLPIPINNKLSVNPIAKIWNKKSILFFCEIISIKNHFLKSTLFLIHYDSIIAFSFKKNHVFIFYISPNVQKIVFDKEVNKKIK